VEVSDLTLLRAGKKTDLASYSDIAFGFLKYPAGPILF